MCKFIVLTTKNTWLELQATQIYTIFTPITSSKYVQADKKGNPFLKLKTAKLTCRRLQVRNFMFHELMLTIIS